MKMEIKPSDIEDLARGAAFLGSGGGGDPYIGGLLLQSAIEHGQAPQIISVDDIDDDAVVVPIAMMGAPTVMLEKSPTEPNPNGHYAALKKDWANPRPRLWRLRLVALMHYCPSSPLLVSGFPSSMVTVWGAPFRNCRWLPLISSVYLSPP
jgi:hypothetical protein